MTPKERVRAAIEHRQSDLVPVGEWIIDYEPASAVLGRPTLLHGKMHLARALWEGRRDELVEQQKRDLVELVRRLDLDMVCVDRTWPKGAIYEAPEQLDAETWRDRRGNVYRYSALTEDLMLLEPGPSSPTHEPSTGAGGSAPLPDPSEFEVIVHVMAELGQTHFMFTGTGSAGLPIFSAHGIDAQMLALAEDPDRIGEDSLRWADEWVKEFPSYAARGFDAVIVGHDYGCNTGPFMSPATFRRAYFPMLRRVCQGAHDCGMFLLCHSCGNLRLLLPDMIEAGIDVYQAIQPLEDIAGLKRDFGKDLCLWGGVSNHDLVVATPQEIRHQVREVIETCAPAGGYILGSSHSITVRSKLENIVAMLEAAGRHPDAAHG